jgi:protein-S-isoprenylcysteine O-methyltransferase Ste14
VELPRRRGRAVERFSATTRRTRMLNEVLLLVLRTALEDRTLMRELPGYADYARRTRYRLVPFLW